MTLADDVVLATPRLLLRNWRDEDYEPFAAINADPAVMRYLNGPTDRASSDALADRFRQELASQPYGRWAMEHRGSGQFIGFLGLGHHPAAPEAPEIGWRLASAYWRQGLATEGALAVRNHAFAALGLTSLVSVAVPANAASLAVMKRIGMRHGYDVSHNGLDLTVWVLSRTDIAQ